MIDPASQPQPPRFMGAVHGHVAVIGADSPLTELICMLGVIFSGGAFLFF